MGVIPVPAAPAADPDPRRTQALRLVEADQKATVDLIARLIGIQTATRAAVVPIASGLGGLALSNHNAALALVAIPIVVLAIGIEARTGELQRRAHRRSTYLERIIQADLSALAENGTPVQDQADQALRRQLDGYQYGASRSLQVVGFRALVKGAVRQASSWLYLFLIVLLVVAGLFAESTAPKPAEICLKTESGAVVRIEGSGLTLSGDLTVIPCPPR
jgi:hypothetical protein